MTPLCKAIDCNERIPANLLMCPRHWYLVPAPLRTLVWRAYKPGQENGGPVSQEWIDVARTAINHVAQAEGKPPLPTTAEITKTLELMLQLHKGDSDADSSK